MTTITVDVTKYEYLLERDEWLEALEAAGVDNWEGFDEARAIYQEWTQE